MKKLFYMLVGGLTAGVFWGFFEGMWVYLQPLLPFDFLKSKSILPPENIFSLFLYSVLTYSILTIVIVLCLFLLIKVINRNRPKMKEALLQGLAFYVTLSLFLMLFLGAWYNMLKRGTQLFTPTNILLYFVFFIGVLILCLGITRLYYSFIKGKMQLRFYLGYFTIILLMVAVSIACFSRTHIEVESTTFKNFSAKDYSPKINILFITVDTLRADRLHCYGNERIATPVIDKLAEEGFLFENAIAPINTTTPSHCSIFSSLYPYEHQAQNGIPMIPVIKTLPIILRTMGYRTVAFTSAFTTKSTATGLGPGFDQYFDTLSSWFNYSYPDELERLTFYRMLERLEGTNIPSHIVNKRVLSWLDSSDLLKEQKPFFIWLHYFDPHAPYEPPEPYLSLYTREVNMNDRVERSIALYDGEISYADSQLGILLDKFRKLGLLNNTLVILTSDHGEEFGEHGSWGHGPNLYEESIRVPLIFWWPGKISPGRIPAVVELIDIAPTVLELLNLPKEDQFRGQSYAGLLLEGRGIQNLDKQAFSESSRVPRLISIRTQKWKYISNTHNGESELYDLEADPGERANLVGLSSSQIVKELHESLIDVMGSSEGKDALSEIDNTTKEKLKALGYIQ